MKRKGAIPRPKGRALKKKSFLFTIKARYLWSVFLIGTLKYASFKSNEAAHAGGLSMAAKDAWFVMWKCGTSINLFRCFKLMMSRYPPVGLGTKKMGDRKQGCKGT